MPVLLRIVIVQEAASYDWPVANEFCYPPPQKPGTRRGGLMADELQELQENAEHGAHEKSLAPVTITMAILAVLVASVSLMGHRAHTEEILNQTKATDQWAYYQAKDIRRRSYELFIDEIGVFSLQNSPQVEAVKAKYEKEIEKYKDQQNDAQAEAKKTED